MILGAAGRAAGKAVNCTSIPQGGPLPHGTCLPWQWEGPVPARGFGRGETEERFCGILSLAKTWTGKLWALAGLAHQGWEAPQRSPGHAA